jgi:hypothetical protein
VLHREGERVLDIPKRVLSHPGVSSLARDGRVADSACPT